MVALRKNEQNIIFNILEDEIEAFCLIAKEAGYEYSVEIG